MISERTPLYDRRSFLTHASTLGSAALLGVPGRVAAAEPPPEITRIRIHENPITCTVRFWSLWLHDVGAIKGSPQQIIAQGLDLRFLNELKKVLKA